MRAAPKNQKPVRACIGAVAILPNYVSSRRNSRLPLGINSNGKSWVKCVYLPYSPQQVRNAIAKARVGMKVLIESQQATASFQKNPSFVVPEVTSHDLFSVSMALTVNAALASIEELHTTTWSWDGIGSHGSFVPAPPDTHKRTSKYFVRTTQ